MLPKKLRTDRRAVLLLKRTGQKFTGSFINLQFTRNQEHEESPTKWWIRVSNQTLSKATKRNRCKRMMSEVIRKIYRETKTGFLVGLWLRKAPGNIKLQEFEIEILSLLRKTGILKNT